MKVVSDTSPLSYSVLIGQPGLLGRLFQTVHVPVAVLDELCDSRAPATVREWAQRPPAWVLCDRTQARVTGGVEDPLIARLHRGEPEAILLAQRIEADLLLVDERAAPSVATRKGIKVAGLLAVARLAADRGMLDFPSAVRALRQAGFRTSPDLIKRLR